MYKIKNTIKYLYLSISLIIISCTFTSDKEQFSIVLLGDSTVANYFITHEFRGWGQKLNIYFSNDDIKIVNLAKGGATCKSFIDDKLLDRSIRMNPDYAFIQFGHNDSSQGYNINEYLYYLTKIVTDLQSIGTIPILVTPMHRINFISENELDSELKPFADAMKTFALNNEIDLIDQYLISEDYFESIGEEECLKLSPDRTHFNSKGAYILAGFIAEELILVRPELAQYFKY